MKLQPGMIEAAIAGGNRYFRDKVVTRDHLAAKAEGIPRLSLYVGVDWPVHGIRLCLPSTALILKSHTVQPYGKPGAELSITAMADVMRYIVGSILIPFDAGKQIREFRVPGQARVTWDKLVRLLGEAQGVEYKLAYLDPQEAAAKQEQARKEGNENDEVFWAGKAVMLNGSGLIPEPFDNLKFSFTPESAKETIQRLFGNA
ncbi:hypothetical protein C8F04DRAFT_64914 [Mycena alexandri]|uniref:NmrA-like domain-containing protein n=1 Tax=Mycena alexandri TaxID=1745969 RepID=A0AAD6SKB0_9AGAR|nr:hypothetical protein C8F04DRAFT_64914 [Mycena alexandri]